MGDEFIFDREPMLEMYIFESYQMLEQLEDLLLTVEQKKKMSDKDIGEIFRIMHTIKGSSAMMMYNGISEMSHAVEDVFFIIREEGDKGVDYEELCDIVLDSSDYIKNQVSKIEAGEDIEEADEVLLYRIKSMVEVLKETDDDTSKIEPANQKFYITSANDKNGDSKQKYVIKVNFEKGCQMENIRAFTIVHNLKPLCTEILHRPKNIINDTNSSDWIFQNGFDIYIQTIETREDICQSLEESIFVEDYSVIETTDYSMEISDLIEKGDCKQKYVIKVNFEKGCQMENIRAFTIVHKLNPLCTEILHRPIDIINDTNSSDWIFQNGFDIYIQTNETREGICQSLEESIFVEDYSVIETTDYSMEISDLVESEVEKQEIEIAEKPEVIIDNIAANKSVKQNMISVNLNKLDLLMNLVGEIVITESMVTQNTDLNGLQLDSFNKSVRQLRKLTDELQDIVMDIRMVAVSGMFHKMRRIVRDMSKSLGKEVELFLVGEETELDKSVLDMLSDPMMHLIRNSMDHGIEEPNKRIQHGKSSKGKLKLEARNSGSDVVITITDDGKGIDKVTVLSKAEENGLLTKPKEEMTDKEINMLILLPGFSTKQEVTEFSGRGVGMDVVKQNIEKVGGAISVESEMGVGTTIEIKIPLTLAIIDGMEVSVGKSRYTIPTISIKESFRPESKDIICDPSGNEMMMIRGNCYPIIRLHDFFKTNSNTTVFQEGIIVVVENEKETFCLFVDELLGEQQVVVKPLPSYVNKFVGDVRGIGGCTIMGNGEMSLILDVGGF